jgi:hypothetical protein
LILIKKPDTGVNKKVLSFWLLSRGCAWWLGKFDDVHAVVAEKSSRGKKGSGVKGIKARLRGIPERT